MQGNRTMAPEWHQVDAVMLAWPHAQTDWSPWLEEARQTYLNVIAAVNRNDAGVILLCAPDDVDDLVTRLAENARVLVIPASYNDTWMRDYGFMTCIDSEGNGAPVEFKFNGWGEKQVNTRDSQIAAQVAQRLGLELLPSGLRGEAGGVEQDGYGTLIAHESSWVNENRNPGLSRDDVKARLLRAYGAERMIWSPGVRGEDITDYHIDSLARFTGRKRVLINLPDRMDMRYSFHAAAAATHDALEAAGCEIEVIPEPVIRRNNSLDFVASYANYYVCNGAVIAAEFGDPETDAMAVDALRRHYPDREVITLNVDPLGEMGGGIHCATQQMPAV